MRKFVVVLSMLAVAALLLTANSAFAIVLSPLNGSFEGPTVSQPPYYVEGPVDNWVRNTTIAYPPEGMYDTYGPAREGGAGSNYAAGGTGDWMGVLQDHPDWAWYMGMQQDLGTMTAGETYTFRGTLFGHNTSPSNYQIAFYDVTKATLLKSITDLDFPVALKGNPGEVVNASMSYTAPAAANGDVLRLVLAPRSMGFGTDSRTGIDMVSVTTGLQNLSRGHNILLQRGLQIQALTSPEFDHPTQQFNSARWTESNFTTAHFWANNYPVNQMPAAPGIPWGLTDYDDSGTVVGDLEPAAYPYASSLVSYELKDEQDITAPSEQAYLKSAMASMHVNRPNVITYTNQWGSQVSAAAMQTYMRNVQPDMLSFDTYPFNGSVAGGSPTGFYRDMQKYRKLGLAGNDGTGTQPIPVGLYTQTFTYSGVNNHVVSGSEIRLNNFSAWAFGYKFVDSFMYDPQYSADFAPIMFSTNGSPTPQFYQVAETNRQSRNLGPALIRLVSTDVRMQMGQHKNHPEWWEFWIPDQSVNDRPADVMPWDTSAGPYITSVSAANLGGKNDGLEGDVIVGYFKPLDASFTNAGHENDIYFMIVNGLSDASGLAADCQQRIRLDFNFGSSGIDSLLRLSRETGLVEEVALVHTSGSLYYLDLYLDGGTGDLFKFNNGGTFVPEPGTMCLLGIGGAMLAFGIFFQIHNKRHDGRLNEEDSHATQSKTKSDY